MIALAWVAITERPMATQPGAPIALQVVEELLPPASLPDAVGRDADHAAEEHQVVERTHEKLRSSTTRRTTHVTKQLSTNSIDARPGAQPRQAGCPVRRFDRGCGRVRRAVYIVVVESHLPSETRLAKSR